jgi:O-antigen ligase
MRDHFVDYFLGEHMLLILVLAVIVGALLHGKRLPKSKLYIIWLVIGVYLYLSMWLGAALGNAPAPLWLSDLNFVTWKDYMVIPLVFVATSLVVEDRKAVRTVIVITAITLLFIDRSCILESTSRNWGNFDENKRDAGPLAYGSNQTAAFLAQFAMFFWGLVQFVKAKKYKLLGYGLIASTLFATMYTFSRGGYLAVLVSILVLGILKDRKLLVILGVFLLTWQLIVPTAVKERVTMTENPNGQLEASAQSRIELLKESWNSIVHSPILGNGFATFQYGQHFGGLADTHDWYIKVMVETGIIGLCMYLILFQQTLALSFRLFRRANDPLYRGLGLGLLLAMCSCIVANCFGDRWTYLEITGPMFVLVAAAVRASHLMATEATPKLVPPEANMHAVHSDAAPQRAILSH